LLKLLRNGKQKLMALTSKRHPGLQHLQRDLVEQQPQQARLPRLPGHWMLSLNENQAREKRGLHGAVPAAQCPMDW